MSRKQKPTGKLRLQSRRFKKKHLRVGASPGAFVERSTVGECEMQVIEYASGVKEFRREKVDSLDALGKQASDRVVWLDVQGLGDLKTIEQIGRRFNIHPLALADAVNVPQRPKTDSYGEQILIVARMVRVADDKSVQAEQVTILLGQDYVVTFQEKAGDILDELRKRLEAPTSRVRKSKADFLAYAIIDAIVDGYYPVIDVLGDHLESLESRVLSDPSTQTLVELNHTKNLLVDIRRSIGPQRESINKLIRDAQNGVTDETRIHLRDTYDHCVQTLDVIEMYREMSTGLVNIYLSSVANRSNEVMKVLTIMASIFIPLTFMAGIYGMNFDFMPELHFKWAYPALLSLMAFTGFGMLVYFWRKGWIGK